MYRLDYFEEGVHLHKLQDLDDSDRSHSIIADIERSKSFGEFIRARISPALLLPYIRQYDNDGYHVFWRNCQHFANEIFAGIENEVYLSI